MKMRLLSTRVSNEPWIHRVWDPVLRILVEFVSSSGLCRRLREEAESDT
jgi:hypothetical protein